ncbi:alpha/beta fold hydrolase [Bailinhaonella thermotolerans]|uniref:Alpha/beta fold hydrolase n=1 Tax=Bailinhaonella thermotolerans TaxID=1070861 RepID=A0A3A4AC57_9ACTN|nr:alpha/beta hydrolase [Bailinhaonella thermotolerans]RJL23610.1 alpha/beta fold hydrolase [Bailinhaonella thermotolerans]
MKSYVREWGSGDRIAVLVHGIMSDSRAWWRVGPALAERGYRVLAVDLPGHGASPRAESYDPEVFASALLESVPHAPDLAIGHSLGGLTLGLAVERLRPARAIYSDPAFRMPSLPDGTPMTEVFTRLKNSDAAQVRAAHPGWPEDEIPIELAGLADWDEATGHALAPYAGVDHTPPLVVPSLVQLADPSFLVPPAYAGELQAKGFEVRVVPGAEHTIHRHLFTPFMKSIDDWL